MKVLFFSPFSRILFVHFVFATSIISIVFRHQNKKWKKKKKIQEQSELEMTALCDSDSYVDVSIR